tara:strand:+ start:311 stop:631 length:321 start_codon:yes stop_codon:yes gene_type:complete
MDHLPQRSQESMDKMKNGARKGRARPSNLREQVNPRTMRMWPTPTANEDACGTPNGKMQKMLGNHPDVRNTGVGTLNPQWVEWLMGYPRSWTDLTDGSKSQPISQE